MSAVRSSPVAPFFPAYGDFGRQIDRSTGKVDLRLVVAKLERSLRAQPRQALIVYVNPHALAAIARSELFERVTTIADRMPMAAVGAPLYEQAAVFVTRRGL